MKAFVDKYKENTDNVISVSQNTLIIGATRISDGMNVIVKRASEDYPSKRTQESILLDWKYTKELNSKYPEHFIEPIEWIEDNNGGCCFIQRDDGAVDLSSTCHKYSLSEFLVIAKDMAHCLQVAHSSRIFHRDIKLANFIITSSGKVKLIDFGMSIILPKKNDVVVSKNMIGTVSYMSPEQSGRISKTMDFRSDIYSLGICFYEMLTGKLPFSGDIMTILHSHITKKLPDIPDIPWKINQLIQKMCSKDPKNRYYSMNGVSFDLQYISREFKNIEKLENFIIGSNDERQFQIADKIYGREQELLIMKKLLTSSSSSSPLYIDDRVDDLSLELQTSAINVPMIFITGPPGMGKSRLIHELLNDGSDESEIIYASGKFNTFEKNIPFCAILNAMKVLIIDVSNDGGNNTKSSSNASIIQKMTEILCDNDYGRVLYSMIPEITLLLDVKRICSPIHQLGSPEENRDRIFESFIRFFHCFLVTNKQKLILFLDDLQWADVGSFQFIEYMTLKSSNIKNNDMLIIGAYRDNELKDNYALMQLVDELNKRDQQITTICLSALSEKHIVDLVDDTIGHDFKSMQDIVELSQLIHKKTLGNPLFVKEIFLSLYVNEMIHLNDYNQWDWNIKQIETIEFSSDVVDVMIGALKTLSEDIQLILNAAACIGDIFHIDEISHLYDSMCKDNEIKIKMLPLHDILSSAQRDGWICQQEAKKYRFSHDKLKESCHALFPLDHVTKIHLIIGKYMNQLLTMKWRESDNKDTQLIFSVANHLNFAKDLIECKQDLLSINIEACSVALENGANGEALKFSTISVNILNDLYDGDEDNKKVMWLDDYDTALKAYMLHANTTHINMFLDESKACYKLLMANVIDRLDRLYVYRDYMKAINSANDHLGSYTILMETLKLFEITQSIPLINPMETITWAYSLKMEADKKIDLLGGIENISTLKVCLDPEIILLIEIICESMAALMLAPSGNSMIFPTVAVVSFYLLLTNGITHHAPLAFSLVGWIFNIAFCDKNANAIVRESERLYQLSDVRSFNIPATQFYLGMASLFSGNYKQSIYYLKSAAKYSIAHKEYVFGIFSLITQSSNSFLNGCDYHDLLKKIDYYRNYLESLGNGPFCDNLEVHCNFVKRLTGELEQFNPIIKTPGLEKFKGFDAFFPSVKGILFYHFGDYKSCHTILESCEDIKDHTKGFADHYDRFLFLSLSSIQMYNSTKEEKYYDRAVQIKESFKCYADISPEYLFPKYYLMDVYIRCSKCTSETRISLLSELDMAIATAKKYGLKILAAIATEIIVDFCIDILMPDSIIANYALDLFSIWNSMRAAGKLTQLKIKYSKFTSNVSSALLLTQNGASTGTGGGDSSFPQNIRKNSTSDQLIRSNGINGAYGKFGKRGMSTDSIETSSDANSSNSLDMMNVMTLMQNLSKEITVPELISTGLCSIVKTMGANRAILFLVDKVTGKEYVEAIGCDSNVKMIHLDIENYKSEEIICSALFKASKLSKQHVIIHDISSSDYANYTYFKENPVKTIYLHPMKRKGNYVGMIYLENTLIAGVFDDNKNDILDCISSQLLISYENAVSYENIASLNASYERFLPKEFLKQLGKGNNIRNIICGDSITKNMCIMFSDIRGFTSITENMSAEQSFSFVNGILSCLSPVIRKNNGFIDKFIGDCIMALFPYSAQDAVQCGIEMTKALEDYNQLRSTKVAIGIGIHYGSVMMGTIGEDNRMDATVISDVVNTASRVEALTKTLGAPFVVTDSVIKNLSTSSIHTLKKRRIGKYILKGKTLPIELFQIISNNRSSPSLIDISVDKMNTTVFSHGLELFEKKKFIEATGVFSILEHSDNTSKYLLDASKIYSNYIELLAENWNGEIKLDKDGNVDL